MSLISCSQYVSGQTDNITNFGVFAALEVMNEKKNVFLGFNHDEVDLQEFMTNVPVIKNSVGDWVADPPHYWPVLQDKQLSFFAYTPHSSNAKIEAKAGWEYSSTGEDSKKIKITYTMDPDPQNHADLCVASAILNQSRTPNADGSVAPVQFKFKHALSFITFKANYEGNLPDNIYLRIDELVLRNVYNTNTLVYNSGEEDFFSWELISADAETIDFSNSLISSRFLLSSSNPDVLLLFIDALA